MNASQVHQVLVVDDDILTSSVLREYLETVGYSVLIAEDCHQAEEILRKREKVDVVILDYLMSDGNGTDLLQTMAKQKELQRPPVILASSIVDQENPDWKALCKRLPSVSQALIRDYINKPYSFDAMDDVLRKAITEGSAPTRAQILSGDFLSSSGRFPPQQSAA